MTSPLLTANYEKARLVFAKMHIDKAPGRTSFGQTRQNWSFLANGISSMFTEAKMKHRKKRTPIQVSGVVSSEDGKQSARKGTKNTLKHTVIFSLYKNMWTVFYELKFVSCFIIWSLQSDYDVTIWYSSGFSWSFKFTRITQQSDR